MNNRKIKQMAGLGLLIALVVVLQSLGGMIPPIGGFSISLVLIPIVLGAALYGPIGGVILGGAFGVIVVINCITGADVGGQMVFQAGPVLCIAVVMGKGILAGLASGLVYHILKNKAPFLGMVLAAAICPIVNTGVFVACMLTFFRDVLSAWAGGGDLMAYVLSGLMLCNFVPELIINLVFTPASNRILKIVTK